jgi:selenocysteine lyase/cysteine desulfurase
MPKTSSNQTRRTMLKSAAAISAASLMPLGAQGKGAKEDEAVMDLSKDEKYWAEVAKDYDVDPDIINLENGYWGLMSRPVLETYLDHIRMVNRENSYYARRGFKDDFKAATERVVTELGAKDGEIVLTRNATEALQGLINGYDRLKPGEAVMYADLDYYSMITAMDTLATKNNCEVVRLNIPEPVDYDGLIEFYRAALADNPKVRLLLLTHIGHRTGLQIPVREITQMARAAGVDVIVDAAHSYGQLDVKIDDIGADFIGFNLHKWIGAPLGVGAMYIRENRLDTIAPNPSAENDEKDSIVGRVHTGTTNFAAIITLPVAFDYHARVGARNKEARLRYLRDVWVDAVRDIKNLSVLTGNDPRLHGGITSLRFDGKTSVAENKAIVERLLKEHGIFTTHRDGVAKGACVRVTPSIYNSLDDVQQLAKTLRTLSTQM